MLAEEDCVGVLTHVLGKYAKNDPALNGFVSLGLTDLAALPVPHLDREALDRSAQHSHRREQLRVTVPLHVVRHGGEAAARAGIKVGDVILRFGEVTLSREGAMVELRDAIRESRKRARVPVRVLRGTKEIELEIVEIELNLMS